MVEVGRQKIEIHSSSLHILLPFTYIIYSISTVPRLIGTGGQKSPLCGFPHTWVVGGTKLATLTTV